jgi:ribosome biogenesis GTPase A
MLYMAGVTRSLQWIRLKQEAGDQSNVMELLDSPGIIPAKALDQANAMKLAICNDIGKWMHVLTHPTVICDNPE